MSNRDLVLAALEKNGPMTPKSIAHEVRLDKSIVSKQLKQLQSLGRVKWSYYPQDMRCRIYHLEGATT